MSKSPIFISGIGRSGTSAVISAVAEHKQVVKPQRIGEAPFISHFVNFLMDYEDNSPGREYNLKNYQLDADERAVEFSRLLSMIQYGEDVSGKDVVGEHWIAKVSLSVEAYEKALHVFKDVRQIYVMRNGVEVVNSAKSFEGFAHLKFEQLCHRWVDNINQCRYIHSTKNCAVLKHHELVQQPHQVFEEVFQSIGLESDDTPAEFISTKLFNSSFDKTSELKSTANVFEKRLDCWSDWSKTEKDTFKSICNEVMEEFDFQRPYTSSISALPIADGVTQNKQRTNIEITETETTVDNASAEKLENFHKQSSLLMNFPEFDYHANPSVKNSYLFMENPKVASTSILKGLHAMEYGSKKSSDINPHDRNNSPIPRMSQLDSTQQINMLFSPDVFKFTFVRNPYVRLLSAYLSKIERSLRPKAEILGIINGVNKKEIVDLDQSVSFAEFVEVVCAQNPTHMNPHWKPQEFQVMSELIDYNFIGRLENLNHDYSYVCSQILGSEAVPLTQSRNKTSSSALLAKYYTDDIAKSVLDKFQGDFNRFSYPMELSLHEHAGEQLAKAG